MAIYGISNNVITRPTTQLPVRDNTRMPAQAPASLPIPAAATRTPANAKSVASTVPAEPPPGTDPALWSVLSGEERAFFAKAGSMGPLTYGRAFSDMKAAQIPANRGGRLDIKI